MKIFIGDSHILTFENKIENSKVKQYSGCSISGLSKEESTLNAKIDIFKQLNKKHDQIYLMFGKVDIEWIWPYKKELKIDTEDYIERTIDKYKKFLLEIKREISSSSEIIILGIHLPSLNSTEMLKCINKSRNKINSDISEIIPEIKELESLKKRTEHILKFNFLLKQLATELHLEFKDISNEIIDKETGIIQSKFIIKEDHHLNRLLTGDVWISTHF